MPGIAAWEDDPHATPETQPVSRPVPSLDHAGLPLAIVGTRPAPRAYATGTHGFRYWTAADSLARSVRCWERAVPAGTRWHNRRPLGVDLDAGDDLNAYYDRQELCFFHARVRGVTVYSGESPDVVCHELGHALLDAIRPQLWNAASIEVASFHESFGDISAILSALELPSVRDDVLGATGGRVSRASRVSRLAEQLGWAIRQSHPDAVDPDCLRNAVNSFFYRQPEGLPPMAPASALSSEPHSFSRVFTAAWLESLAGMMDVRGPGAEALSGAAIDAGRLLAEAASTARVSSNYFAQVASELLAADQRLTRGEYRAAIRRAFVGRGILSMSSAASAGRRVEATGAGRRPRGALLQMLDVPIDGRAFGLRLRRLLVEAPIGAGRWSARSAAADLGPLPAATPERASRAFVEDLLRRGRVDTSALAPRARADARAGRTTHALVRAGEGARLIRRLFHERPDWRRPPMPGLSAYR